MSDLNSLTDDILKIIVHYVPARDRLISCCLVSSRLQVCHRCPGTGPTGLGFPRFDCLFPKVRASKGCIGVAGCVGPALDKPKVPVVCSDTAAAAVPQPPGAEGVAQLLCTTGTNFQPHPGVIPGCTNLTKLILTDCSILNSEGGAEVCGSLSSLVHLQHLHVHPRDEQDKYSTIEGFSSGTLPCLQQLTFLNVYNLSAENISELSALINLQELGLKADSSVIVGPSSIPGLVFPNSLTDLTLRSHVEAALLSAVPAGLNELVMFCAVEGPAEGLGSLLSCMAGVQSLTKLDFYVTSDSVDLPPAGPAYSALTSSSSLVELAVYGSDLPPGVWPFMFPAARTLQHLTHFSAPFAYGCSEPVLHGAWGASDVACLVSCCANLRTVEELAMQYGSHVSQLHKLTALTKAELNYGAAADRSAVQETMQGLTALTQLRGLSVNVYCYIVGVATVLPLTTLTSLSSMSLPAV